MKRILAIVVLGLFVSGLVMAQSNDPNISPALVSVGTLAAGNVYMSFLVLGTVADAYTQGLYTEATATAFVNEVLHFNAAAQESLLALLESGNLSEEDEQVLLAINEVYGLLELEGQALVLFITDHADSGQKFQQYRTQAWEKILVLLGIPKVE